MTSRELVSQEDIESILEALVPPGVQRRPTTIAKLRHFWIGTHVQGDCWEWTGFKNTYGYGVLAIGTAKMLVHRLAFILAKGSIPEGLIVRHSCDNRACINPAHLEVGTWKDNVQDMMKRGRCNRDGTNRRRMGVTNGSAKLTEDLVREARKRFNQGGITAYRLAKQYGVTARTMADAVCGHTWPQVAASN